MRIAQQLKEKNIAEYLIYMWQVEDLIRANDCDLDKLRVNVIDRFPVGERDGLERWYGDYGPHFIGVESKPIGGMPCNFFNKQSYRPEIRTEHMPDHHAKNHQRNDIRQEKYYLKKFTKTYFFIETVCNDKRHGEYYNVNQYRTKTIDKSIKFTRIAA